MLETVSSFACCTFLGPEFCGIGRNPNSLWIQFIAAELMRPPPTPFCASFQLESSCRRHLPWMSSIVAIRPRCQRLPWRLRECRGSTWVTMNPSGWKRTASGAEDRSHCSPAPRKTTLKRTVWCALALLAQSWDAHGYSVGCKIGLGCPLNLELCQQPLQLLRYGGLPLESCDPQLQAA